MLRSDTRGSIAWPSKSRIAVRDERARVRPYQSYTVAGTAMYAPIGRSNTFPCAVRVAPMTCLSACFLLRTRGIRPEKDCTFNITAETAMWPADPGTLTQTAKTKLGR